VWSQPTGTAAIVCETSVCRLIVGVERQPLMGNFEPLTSTAVAGKR
jgi:hypothetical protein